MLRLLCRYCYHARVNNISLSLLDWLLVSRSIKCWDFLRGLTCAHRDRLRWLVLNMRRSSTPGDHIDGYGRSLLNENQLNILGRATVVFLNLCYELGALFNHVVYCVAIPTGCGGVPTVVSQMSSLVTIVAHHRASSSPGHTTTAATSKGTSSRGTAMVTIAVIILGFILHSVGVRDALFHEVIATTLLFIMPH